MKKIYILLLSFSLFNVAANAQLPYGLKAGIDIAKESFSNSQFSESYYTNFNGGAFINYKANIPVALQLELIYSGEGPKKNLPAPLTQAE